MNELERHPSCGSLPLHSFISAPMQRITRMPLLVDAVCHRMDPTDPDYHRAMDALHEMQKVMHLYLNKWMFLGTIHKCQHFHECTNHFRGLGL